MPNGRDDDRYRWMRARDEERFRGRGDWSGDERALRGPPRPRWAGDERGWREREDDRFGGPDRELQSVGSPGVGGGTRGDDIGRRASRWWGQEAPSGGFRGVGPRGYTRSDLRILEDACDRLMIDDEVDASRIDVSVERGEVTLAGAVPARWMKRRAEECVEDVPGVRDVRNELRVQARDGDRDELTGASRP